MSLVELISKMKNIEKMEMEGCLDITKALFEAFDDCLYHLAELENIPRDIVQQHRIETQNFYDRIPPLLRMLHGYFKFKLAPLLYMLPEDEDHPEILWVRKWFTEPEHNVEEAKYLTQYIVKAAAEAFALQCQVLKGFWERVCWSLLPVFRECFRMKHFTTYGFVSDRFNNWIIRVVGDPEICPNPDLRLQMLVLYRWLLKVDVRNCEQALDSLILACSSLDRHRQTINIIDMSDIIECLSKFTEIEPDNTYLIQFGTRVSIKLRDHRKMRKHILIHDLSHEYAMGLKTLPMPQEYFCFKALLNYIKHEAQIHFMAFQEEPDNWSHLDKLEKACEYLDFFGEHFKSPFQEPDLLSLMAETVMYVMETVVRCIYQSEPNLDYICRYDFLDGMLSVLCHKLEGNERVINDYTVLEPVGNEIIRRYKERICKIRTLIKREYLEYAIFFGNILYNKIY